MKLTFILVLASLSLASMAQSRPQKKSICASLAQKNAEAIARVEKTNTVDSRSTDVDLIQKSRDGKTEIYDIQVGGRVRNPYFKVTIKKGEHVCEFKSLIQDQARG